MCELGFFAILLESNLLNVDRILGLTFLPARKDFEGFKTAFFPFTLVEFCGRRTAYNSRLFATKTLSAINLVSQQKTTKLFFSSRVRKQFKLLAVPFK